MDADADMANVRKSAAAAASMILQAFAKAMLWLYGRLLSAEWAVQRWAIRGDGK